MKTLKLFFALLGLASAVLFFAFLPSTADATHCGSPVNSSLSQSAGDFCPTAGPAFCDMIVSSNCEDAAGDPAGSFDRCELIGGTYFCWPVAAADTIDPSVSVSYSPANPTTLVTITTTASDSESGLAEVVVYINLNGASGDTDYGDVGEQSTCLSSPCSYDRILPAGDYTYMGFARDRHGNISFTTEKTVTLTGSGNAPTVNLIINGDPDDNVSASEAPATTDFSWTTTNSPTSCTASGPSPWSGSSVTLPNGNDSFVLTTSGVYTLTCINGFGSGSNQVNVTVSGAIEVTPLTINFGDVAQGSFKDLPVTVANNGGGSFSGSVTVPAGPFSCVSGCTYTNVDQVNPATVTIRFTPAVNGSVSAVLSFSGSGGATAGANGTGVPAGGAFDFSLTNGGNKTVVQGSSVTNSITTTLTSGTTEPVSFIVSGLPAGVTHSLSSVSCSPGPLCAPSLTLDASAGATIGDATITVTGTGGGKARTTFFTLTVIAVGSFDITPITLNCGTTPVGTPVTCNFQAVNGTGAAVTINSITSSNPQFTPPGGSVTVPVGGVPVSIPITFNATTDGTHNFDITFTLPGPVTIVRAITGTATAGGGGCGAGPACTLPDTCVAGVCTPPGPTVPTTVIISFQNPLGSLTFTGLINNIINFLFTIAVILAPILLVVAGVIFMTAAGDPAKVKTARSMLMWTIVGFGVILISKGLVTVLKGILGVTGP